MTRISNPEDRYSFTVCPSAAGKNDHLEKHLCYAAAADGAYRTWGFCMNESLLDLEEKLKSSRSKLEALAERAAQLRNKLEADTALISSMEKLAEQAKRAPNLAIKEDYQKTTVITSRMAGKLSWLTKKANEQAK
jgi:hypothetical protein